HIGRLEKGVDAGEMRQLAAREGGDRLVGQALGAWQAHVERPLLLLSPSRLREPALGVERPPALRRPLVEIRVVPARAPRRPEQSGPARTAGKGIEHQGAPWACCVASMNGCSCGIKAATKCILPEMTPRRDVISSAIIRSLRAGPWT